MTQTSAGNRYWIRRDRESYLLAGLVAAMLVSSFMINRWQRRDEINAFKNLRVMKLKTQGGGEKRLNETGLSISRQKATTEKYYKLNPGTGADVPGLDGGE